MLINKKLNKTINRSSFSCGNAKLDTYFQRFASQGMHNGLAIFNKLTTSRLSFLKLPYKQL